MPLRALAQMFSLQAKNPKITDLIDVISNDSDTGAAFKRNFLCSLEESILLILVIYFSHLFFTLYY